MKKEISFMKKVGVLLAMLFLVPFVLAEDLTNLASVEVDLSLTGDFEVSATKSNARAVKVVADFF